MTAPRRSAAPRRPLLPALLALIVALLGAGVAPAAVAADGAITWAVSPSTDGVPDKRAWVELELAPGASASDEAVVRNLSDQPVTFSITSADGYFTDTGRFNMLNSDQESVDAGLWISAPETVTVDPGSSGVVPFTVTVPDNATPGDHAAGIAASVLSQGTEAGGANVGVESRIGFRVMTRVTGEVTPSFSVEDLASDYRLSWNPFQPGSLSLVADVVNTGNVRLLLDGTASAQGATAPVVAADAPQQELLPGDRRSVSVQLDGIWPLFGVGADLTIAPTVAAADQEPVATAPVTESITVAAVPVPQLLVVLGVALILAALLAGRSRSRRRIAALVQQAKEEGLREGARVSS
ncbi:MULTISPECIES: WxL protein peptidoglycan domain-containing protein [unclassified Rathayibacter]|uniref:WxL protein peptidoglycan domain-containing protein n=1 Tax=unclassified Rathayibacter TaxID=2609250 RepID=UPI000CE89D72|nr:MULTISPECIES: DUF916 domain-containing protein [unclassified Rathayibacter]PPF27930.1 hypothetical protein C5C54_08775 [Rathayibacter sp. AY1F2]PPH44209.1 hypothetical protein C5C42_12595 [Rathayibacter sp. AY1F7]